MSSVGSTSDRQSAVAQVASKIFDAEIPPQQVILEELEYSTAKMQDGEVAVIGLAFEEDEEVLDQRLGRFKTTIVRFDAATVAAEVEEAQQLADEMARQARKELRDEKKAVRKEKREEKKAKLSADWEGFKARFKKSDNE